MENAELKVKGMHCNSCAELIKDRLSKLPGVTEADASYADETVKVVFDAGKTQRGGIEAEITKMGYTVENSVNASSPSPSPGAAGESSTKTTLREGIIYGLTPHIGCIGFIVASVLGVTVAVELFRPLLMNPWFFHILVVISIGFATASSMFYLNKQGLLSWKGVRRKKNYLGAMYGSTVGINLLLFIFIFPMLANLDTGSFANPTGAVVLANSGNGTGAGGADAGIAGGDYSVMRLQVNIPCPGHAPLISGDLKTISGVTGVKFEFPNYFDVAFDSEKTSRDEILALEVFDTYPATVVSEPATAGAASFSGAEDEATGGGLKEVAPLGNSNSAGSGGSTCGTGGASCGGTCGTPSCGCGGG
ncbi:cation transporter [Candidatus Micrarchaeota archaeon]|nr:cation transporter [Candidatus Micrarchaeota archaeon]